MNRLWGGLTVSVLISCQGAPEPATSLEPRVPTPRLEVTARATSRPSAQASPSPEVSALLHLEALPASATRVSQVRWLAVSVELAPSARERRLAFEFSTPSGAVFENRAVAVASGAAGASFNWPVAGTTIDSLGLSGVWQLHVLLDGARLVSSPFELQP